MQRCDIQDESLVTIHIHNYRQAKKIIITPENSCSRPSTNSLQGLLIKGSQAPTLCFSQCLHIRRCREPKLLQHVQDHATPSAVSTQLLSHRFLHSANLLPFLPSCFCISIQKMLCGPLSRSASGENYFYSTEPQDQRWICRTLTAATRKWLPEHVPDSGRKTAAVMKKHHNRKCPSVDTHCTLKRHAYKSRLKRFSPEASGF